jgi:hypothetical protein
MMARGLLGLPIIQAGRRQHGRPPRADGISGCMPRGVGDTFRAMLEGIATKTFLASFVSRIDNGGWRNPGRRIASMIHKRCYGKPDP